VLKTYLPILVFAVLGLTVGGLFAMLNHLIGPKRPAKPTAASRRQGEPYESGIPVEPSRGLRFGVSFYLVAMLFILSTSRLSSSTRSGRSSRTPTASSCSAS
jgi:NADH-quinone oxidoreductase subunit A